MNSVNYSNHVRMLEQTGQTEEQHRQALHAAFEGHREMMNLMGLKYFKGCADRRYEVVGLLSQALELNASKKVSKKKRRRR